MVSNSAGPRPIRGRFAAKTPTQSKGFPGVQPTETPTSGSSSGTTVQGTKTTATRRTKILQQSLPTLILPFIKIAIFVSAMVIIGLVFFVVIMMVVRNLHAKGAWESHQYPAEVHFSEIAVSTTSQECNEMARVMVSEGFNIFAIAFAMQLCLSLAEPQRSGFGGAATAVLVEGGKKGCQIIDGFWDTRKKKLFKQITEEERMNKLFTTKRLAESILLPSDTSVARFFLGYLDSDEIDRLADFLKMYKLEYQPVRLSLQRAIEYDPLWLLHSKDLARFFKNDEQMRTLKEGDIVESENFGEYFLAQKSYIQNASEFWRGYLVSFFFKDMKTNVWSDDDFPRNKTSRCFSVGGDVTLCAPRRFAKSFSKYASAKSSDEESEHGEKPFIMTEAMRTLKFFEELEKQSKAAKQQRTTQEHHYTERTLEPTKTTERQIPINEVKQKRSVPNVEEKNTTSEEVQLPSTSSSDKASTTTTIKFTTTEQTTTQEKVDYDDDEEEDEDEESVDETSDWKKAPDEMGWDSNMFVIVDRKTDKAIAYSGTLGSRFGSRVLVTQQFLLNNLDEYARKGHYPYNRFNGLFPMIATSNGKIKFAYASVGGSIDDSRSLPRTITSLLLNIFQRQKLSATLGWPLLYSFNGTTYRDGIRAANIFEVLKNRIRLLLQAPNLADESVSIEVLVIRSTMDDTSSTPIAASANIRYMMAFTYLILSVIGIIPNIILAITLYKLGSMPKQNVFVLLAKQILISDFCQLSSQLFVAFPLALYGRNIYEGSAAIWIYNVVNFLDTVGYNGVLDFTFIMAMNRVTVFLLPKVHQAFFGGRAAMWTVVFVWSFLFMQIIVANVMRCHKQFTYEEFYFYFQCANRDALHVEIWLESMRYQSFTFPVIMFFTYVVIFIFIKTRLSTHSDGTTKHRKYEINLLLQAAIITFFLVLQTASFSLLPMIGTGNERFYSSLAQNVISILNNSANPYVYFFFNTQIREGMLSLLRCKSIPVRSKASMLDSKRSVAGTPIYHI